MLLVVIYHSIVFWRGDWFTKNPVDTAEGFTIFAEFLITFLMYGFVLVSGYIFYYQRCECGKYEKFFPFILNKAKRLIVPYVFTALVWVIPIQCIFLDYTIPELIKNFLLALSPNQLWFLWMLFDLFVIFHLLSKFLEKNSIIGTVIVLGMFAVGTLGIIPNAFMITRALTYAPAFYLGFLLRKYGTSALRKIPLPFYIVAHITLFAISKLLPIPSGIIGRCLCILINFLLNHIGALSAFLVLTYIAGRINTNAKPLRLLTKSSLTVYLFHQQAIYPFVFLLNGLITPYLIAPIAFIGAMSVSLIIFLLLSKFNITRFLIGEKPIKKQG